MSTSPGILAPTTDRPELSEADHHLWQALVAQRCGLRFGESRKAYLSRRLWQRMRALDLSSYGDYYRRLLFEGEGGDEWPMLLELLVNRETTFFRHPPSFEALRQVLALRTGSRGSMGHQRHLSLWSAGCSTGEEAYSLAMTALEVAEAVPEPWTVRVLGTDISSVSRQRARRGLYRPERMASLSESQRRRFLRPVPRAKVDGGQSTADVEVSDSLKSVVRFEAWNLMDPDSYPATAQDAIFCQNLLVYLGHADRLAVVERLCRCLAPGGDLFLAPGEVVGLRLPGIELVHVAGCSIYRRAVGPSGVAVGSSTTQWDGV